MPFEPIRKILPQAIQAAGISRQVTAARVVAMADQAIQKLWGADKAKYVQAVSYKDGILKIAAQASAALQELTLDRVRIQNEINRQLGFKAIQQIHAVSV